MDYFETTVTILGLIALAVFAYGVFAPSGQGDRSDPDI